jgi:hypothetical protein
VVRVGGSSPSTLRWTWERWMLMPMRNKFLKFLADKEPKMGRSPKEEQVFLWACRGRTTTLLPWLSCLPEALFLSRKKETSLTDMDIFRSQFPTIRLKDGNSLCNSKRGWHYWDKIEAAIRPICVDIDLSTLQKEIEITTDLGTFWQEVQDEPSLPLLPDTF